jgi:tRNA-splicing ligase RtcB
VKIENHHNFAWNEKQSDGSELIVHRKGATPAQKGVLGLIPSSMASSCFIVEGTGNDDSLQSAAHGSGRRYSRGVAKSTFTMSDIKKRLKNAGVELIGGGADEAPQAYKNIEQVMNSQKDLVNVIGKFDPRIVKMAK